MDGASALAMSGGGAVGGGSVGSGAVGVGEGVSYVPFARTSTAKRTPMPSKRVPVAGEDTPTRIGAAGAAGGETGSDDGNMQTIREENEIGQDESVEAGVGDGGDRYVGIRVDNVAGKENISNN